MAEGAITKVTISDPDISGRIDALLVQKVKTSNDAVVKTWRLVNYQSTGDIDLKNGEFYLKVFPYFINIDPLPVWFIVKNSGTKSLITQCITTERRQGFKNIKRLKSGEEMNIAGCYRLEYRVVRYSAGNLGVQVIDGIGRRRRNRLVSKGVMKVSDLCGKEALELSKATGISVMRLAEYIRKAEIACGIKVSEEDYGSISEETIIELLKTPVEDLVKKTKKTKTKIEELMDTIGDITIVIDAAYMRNLSLDTFFG